MNPETDNPIPGLEKTIEDLLARQPLATVPPGFATRVAHLAAREPLPPSSLWLGWGPRLALASGAVLTIAMFAVAPHTVPSLTNLRFDAELVLLAELSGLALFAQRLLPRS